jgi:hypothetical protein
VNCERLKHDQGKNGQNSRRRRRRRRRRMARDDQGRVKARNISLRGHQNI